jgi:hypothetical protein
MNLFVTDVDHKDIADWTIEGPRASEKIRLSK